MVSFSPSLSDVDNTYHDIDSSSVRRCKEDTRVNLVDTKKGDPSVPPSALSIHSNPVRKIKLLSGISLEPEPHRRLSTQDILRLAGKKFIQTSSPEVVLPERSGGTLPFVGLSLNEVKDIDIVQKLLSAADNFGNRKYDQTWKLLDECDTLSSKNGNKMERFIYYFSKALREKIGRETGRGSSKDSLKEVAMQVDESVMKLSPVILAFHREMPFCHIGIQAATQAITERVTHARRVHVIDLEIRSGIHTSVLMQSLVGRVECPIELLKVTAITTKSRSIIEETGKRLRSFAKSINLPFLYNIVMVPDLRELREELFDLQRGGAVVVNALFALRFMICRQDELESLMRILRRINPCVMVVTENEGKHNSPVFVNRFIEVLFYFGAYLDCIEDVLGHNSQLRMQSESIYMNYHIRNMVVAEGDERTCRHVKLEIWRTFFSRFFMKEEKLNSSPVTHASLVAKTFACWNSCTIYKDGKSLIVGWKD